jgi:hypothetical protein
MARDDQEVEEEEAVVVEEEVEEEQECMLMWAGLQVLNIHNPNKKTKNLLRHNPRSVRETTTTTAVTLITDLTTTTKILRAILVEEVAEVVAVVDVVAAVVETEVFLHNNNRPVIKDLVERTECWLFFWIVTGRFAWVPRLPYPRLPLIMTNQNQSLDLPICFCLTTMKRSGHKWWRR